MKSLFTVAFAAGTGADVAANAAQGIPTAGLVQSLGLPVLLIAVFYFMLIRPQRKRDKQTKEMLAALKVGDQVVSIGGIIGTIFSIKDDTVTIEVGADKTKIKFERSAIKGIR
ncbi:MAG: preprotein translocase subunit YajC [Clostridiaceae bacterium]|jgi:preprotein translocase subunit YajC|nr:preprotein translocase subunit YajC [Clostridiaceae bacterium]